MSSMRLSLISLLLFWCSFTHSRSHIGQLREPVDMTWAIDEQAVFWPGVRGFFYTRKVASFDDQENWYAMNEFCTGEHGGTHLDAPFHFHKFGWKVGEIPIYRLLAHAVVIDMSDIVTRLGPAVQLQEADLVDWERIYGSLPTHCVVLVRFGWSDYYKQKDKYLGLNGTAMVFPGIAPDAAQWLIKTKKVIGIGVDTASVDAGSSRDFETHRLFAKQNIYCLENLRIPQKIPAKGFNLLVMPMKLKDGSGAPTRVVAIPDVRLSMDINCLPMDMTISNVPWYGHTSVVLSSLLLLGMYAINCFTL